MFHVHQSPEFEFKDKLPYYLSNFGAEGGEGQGFSRRRKKVAKIPMGYKFEQNRSWQLGSWLMGESKKGQKRWVSGLDM